MAEAKTVADLAGWLATCPPEARIYVSTENHTEPLASMSIYASGAISLDGDSDENYYPGRLPPNE
jgi:hypothetical protein